MSMSMSVYVYVYVCVYVYVYVCVYVCVYVYVYVPAVGAERYRGHKWEARHPRQRRRVQIVSRGAAQAPPVLPSPSTRMLARALCS